MLIIGVKYLVAILNSVLYLHPQETRKVMGQMISNFLIVLNLIIYSVIDFALYFSAEKHDSHVDKIYLYIKINHFVDTNIYVSYVYALFNSPSQTWD